MASNAIHLNLINQSDDTDSREILVFQKNKANFDTTIIAWLVIRYCAPGDTHPFEFSMQTYVSASDSWGNIMPKVSAMSGDAFQVVRNKSGDQLEPAGNSSTPVEIQIKNSLDEGAINATIYRDNKLLGSKTSVAPGQLASFNFGTDIFIGVVKGNDIEESQVLDAAIEDTITTQISLFGIKSADIVLTGGGSGASAKPYQFTLQNIIMD